MSTGIPTGVVVAFAGHKYETPEGWAFCDGSMLSNTEVRYRPLFAVIGTAHGGDGAPLFQLPDYRGRFLRGVDDGTGRDPDASNRKAPGANGTGNKGAEIGSIQDDSLGRHSHTIPGKALEADSGGGAAGAALASNSQPNNKWNGNYPTSESGGSLETRPKNAYVNYIIKL